MPVNKIISVLNHGLFMAIAKLGQQDKMSAKEMV
jgi:hypothetical protein